MGFGVNRPRVQSQLYHSVAVWPKQVSRFLRSKMRIVYTAESLSGSETMYVSRSYTNKGQHCEVHCMVFLNTINFINSHPIWSSSEEHLPVKRWSWPSLLLNLGSLGLPHHQEYAVGVMFRDFWGKVRDPCDFSWLPRSLHSPDSPSGNTATVFWEVQATERGDVRCWEKQCQLSPE